MGAFYSEAFNTSAFAAIVPLAPVVKAKGWQKVAAAKKTWGARAGGARAWIKQPAKPF